MPDATHTAVRALYREHRQGLLTYAMAFTRDLETASELVQAAVLRLLQRRRLPRNLVGYAYRCVRNAAIDHARRSHVEKGALLALPRPAAESSPDPVDSLALRQALAQLDDDERETIILKVFAGLTFAEIARVRRRSANTVASWHRRGLGKLRATLETTP